MKVLMLGWELPPFNSGGLGVACYQMCKHLALSGVEIDFVLPYQPGENISFMRLHAATSLEPHEFVRLAGAYDSHAYSINAQQASYAAYVEKLVTNNHYDAVHAHDWLTFQAGMRAKELTNKPLIAHVHATEFDRAGSHRGNPLVHDIEYNALVMADRIVAVSELTKKLIVREYNIPADKIDVVHNSVDHQTLGDPDTANAYYYIKEMKKLGYKVVVSLGRLSLQKGIDYLLAAAKLALQKNQKLLFLIAGDGEMREQLIAKTAELGIAHNVIFTGFLRGKRWRDTYAIGDMFVMSSVSEPFGLTALEAAGHHNAILLSKQSGVAEVLHCTMQFDFWDTDKLANAILAVAGHDSLQTALADAAQNEIRKLSWQQTAQLLQRTYNTAKALA